MGGRETRIHSQQVMVCGVGPGLGRGGVAGGRVEMWSAEARWDGRGW